MSALKRNQENAVSGKQKDSVQKETPAASATMGVSLEMLAQSSSPALKPQTQNDGSKPAKSKTLRGCSERKLCESVVRSLASFRLFSSQIRIGMQMKNSKQKWVAYSTNWTRRNPDRFLRKRTTFLGSKRSVRFSKRTLHHVKYREKRVHRSELFRIVNLTSVVLIFQNSRKEQRKKPCTKNDAPAEKHGIWRKNVHKLNDKDKTTFFSLS